MNVLINGIGNIGTTLLSILIDYKSKLGINTIYALKNGKVSSWNSVELGILEDKGVIICSKHDSKFTPLDEIINKIDYIFDCNASSIGLENKEWYQTLKNLKGCSAQGTEKGFGIPFMTGINNETIASQKFVQVVSCNTHSLSSLIMSITNNKISNMIEGDFVIVRRSEDIGNHQRLVTANVVSRHLDNDIGTHHAIDVKDLFLTQNTALNIQSSDITTPSQLMHTVRFNLKLKELPKLNKIENSLIENKSISTTTKFDSNVIFDLGRRYSPYGRLFSHAIININNLLIHEKDKRIKGWAFIPQEGNTILSTIHAFLIQTKTKNTLETMNYLKTDLIRPEW